MDFYRAQVLCCGGTGCTSSGSGEIIKRFEEQIVKNGLDKEVKVVRTGCFGLCAAGPVVIVYPEGTFYSHGWAGSQRRARNGGGKGKRIRARKR